MPPTPDPEAAHASLRLLRDRVPRLLDVLGVPPGERVRGLLQTLDTRILPRLSPDFPLMAAITGGGSSGKSTLFNSLMGAALSTVGGRAGLSRRVLVAVHPEQAARPDFLAELFRPFGSPPAAMVDRRELTEPGLPVYAPTPALPPGVVLLDTPDFDVGAAGAYLNRDVAEPVLTAMDVLVYIFTNATYNAKANTDFIREQLTRVGRRPSLLVYRVYRSFADDEVRAHAETVARALYGDDWRPHVLGVFRADDDNAVASGEAPMVPRRVGDGGGPGLIETLAAIDPRALRSEQTEAMIADVADALADVVADARCERDALVIYRDTLRLAEGHAVAAALAHFPLATVTERIRAIFERTDPGFLRFSRKAGRVTGAPFRGLMRLVKGKPPEPGAGAPDPAELTRSALVEAANDLRRQTLAEELATATTTGDPDGRRIVAAVDDLRGRRGLTGAARPLAERSDAGGAVNVFAAAPAALRPVRDALLARRWSDDLAHIGAAADQLLELPPELDAELERIVVDFRAEMSFFNKARAALVASLNLVPPVLGVVYVFATVDPVGGSTIAAKLSSVFGLNDLWATITIPASSGLDEATRNDLKRLLDPVVQRWLASRAAPVEAVLRERTTATALDAAEARVRDADALIAEIEAALATLPARGPA